MSPCEPAGRSKRRGTIGCNGGHEPAVLKCSIVRAAPVNRFVRPLKNLMSVIAVLEDDQRRITAINAAGRTHLAGYEIRVFLSAHEMIDLLSTQAHRVQLISLDRDLDGTAHYDDTCGSGEDVIDFLVRRTPWCPVLIHSSNAMRAPAMHLELAMAGYRVRLCPFRDASGWASDVCSELDYN